MEKVRKALQAVALVLLSFLLSACLSIRITRNVDDPTAHFERAYRQIERIHVEFTHREKRARRLCLLVHDRNSGDLIRVSVPIWIVNAFVGAGAHAREHKHDFDIEKRYDMDWRAIKDLGQFGPGLLVEVDGDTDKVLIWLK